MLNRALDYLWIRKHQRGYRLRRGEQSCTECTRVVEGWLLLGHVPLGEREEVLGGLGATLVTCEKEALKYQDFHLHRTLILKRAFVRRNHDLLVI